MAHPPSRIVPESLHDAPAAVALLYLALVHHGPASAAQLAAHTGLSERTVNKHLRRLSRDGLADSRPDIEDDVRRHVYYVTTE